MSTTSTETWIELCELNDIQPRGSRRVKLGADEIAVFRTAGNAVYAIHKGGPLSEGIVHDTGVTCPLHSMVIDLETGQARGADKGCVKTYPVEIRDDRVFISIPVE